MAKKVKKAATTLVIVALAALIVVGGVLGAVFGISASSAKDAIEVTREEAKIIAQGYVSLRFLTLNPVVQEINSDLEIGNKLTNSYYEYDIDLVGSDGTEYEVRVNSITGEVTMDDVDKD